MRLEILGGLALLVFSGYVSAFEIVGTGKITYVENGWYGEGLAIRDTVGLDGCSAPDTEFAIDAGHPGYKELVSLALSAFTSASDVQLVVEKNACIFGGRTKILSIRLIK